MSNVDSVSQFTADSFSNIRIGVVRGVTLNTSGNGATTNITVPILSGGLTNGGGVSNSGGIIVRRVTVQNPSGSIASANITVCQYNNSTGNVVTAAVLSSVSGVGTFQDLTTGANVFVSGANTSCLYVTVNTVAGNTNTCDITVWGDVVSF